MTEIRPESKEWKFESLNLLQEAFKRAQRCAWSCRDKGKKVTALGLETERRNTGREIYASVLTDPGLWTSTPGWNKKQRAVKSLAESLAWMG